MTKGKSLYRLFRPLVSPRAGFSAGNSPVIAPAFLMLALFLAFTAGQRLYREFYRSPAATVLEVQSIRNRLDRVMTGAPPEAKNRVLGESIAQLTGSSSILTDAVNTVLPGVILLLYVLETGTLLVLAAQFLGGEERDEGFRKHRASRVLAAYVFIPIALRKLASGILIWVQDPGNVWNAPSFEAFRESTTISFSLFSLIDPGNLPFFLSRMLYLFTDPFFLWMFILIAFGFSGVFRVRAREGAVAAAAVTAALTLNEMLLDTLGFTEAYGHIV